jgi:hypothetical protein
VRIEVAAGNHPRDLCPVSIPFPTGAPTALTWEHRRLSVQPDGEAAWFLISGLCAGEVAHLEPTDAAPTGSVRLEDNGTEIAVAVDGEPFTRYRYADVHRPYFWPVLAPGGIPVTRAWPMDESDPTEVRDHPHHRSLYHAYGDVNGVDNWSDEPGHGCTIHRSVDELISGPVFGRMRTTSDWTSAAGAPLLRQTARVTIWRGDALRRILDFDLELTALEEDIRFGDTKEGGILTVRMATALDVDHGGRIQNSYGGIDEAETWGRAAHWCDYHGILKGQRAGICVMDHPDSFRYPTYWHVRNYGLMGANPFALAAYTQGRKEGSYTLPAGESLHFRYRVVVHLGDTREAAIADQYHNFVAPPVAAVKD